MLSDICGNKSLSLSVKLFSRGSQTHEVVKIQSTQWIQWTGKKLTNSEIATSRLGYQNNGNMLN
jgi:hypothetical protein